MILCPLAIDDSWKSRRESKPQVAQLARDRVILPFEPTKPIAEGQNADNFRKLIEGMKIFYHPPEETPEENR